MLLSPKVSDHGTGAARSRGPFTGARRRLPPTPTLTAEARRIGANEPAAAGSGIDCRIATGPAPPSLSPGCAGSPADLREALTFVTVLIALALTG